MTSALPVEGKAFRFAPARDQRPLTTFWKVWSEGNEVYLASRNNAGNQHISVHQSGAIHYRMGVKQKQDLAPLMRLPSGRWQHAVELRFLVSEGALPPLNELKSLKNRNAHVLAVPESFVLHVNLLICDASSTLEPPLPPEFMPAGELLWRSRLRDGRTAALIGRALLESDENAAHVRYIRSELRPTVTFERSGSGDRRVEIYHLHWSASGGNVVLIVPMGGEAFRSDDEPMHADAATIIRTYRVAAPECKCSIAAPDGRPVLQVCIPEFNETIFLSKGKPIDVVLGELQIELLVENIVLGSSFSSAPARLPQALRIGGGSAKSWEYTVRLRFDGSHMAVELLQLSTGLRNVNLVAGIEGLADDEEITLTVPKETIRSVVPASRPKLSIPIVGRLRLRNQQ